MICLLSGQGLVGLMGRQLLLNGLEQALIHDRRLLSGQDLTPVFDLANKEPVPKEVGEAPRPNGTPPRVLPVPKVLALVQMFLALRSRTSSLMPDTPRYRRKIILTRSASSSTTVRLPSFSP